MAKGPLISQAMRELIAAIAVEKDALLAKEVRQEAANRVRGTGGRVPGLSTVQKVVTAAREKDPRDRPWNLGASLAFSIPESATGALMRVKAWCMAAGLTLTLRDAQWIARLISILPEDEHFDPAHLYKYAHMYAIRERVHKALDVQLNTNDLDQGLIARYVGRAYDGRREEQDMEELPVMWLDEPDGGGIGIGVPDPRPFFTITADRRVIVEREVYEAARGFWEVIRATAPEGWAVEVGG